MEMEHFVPLTKAELVNELESELPTEIQPRFRQFANLLSSTIHNDFHKNLEDLKESYRPFDPDPDVPIRNPVKDPDDTQFMKRLDYLLKKANFKKLGEKELNHALTTHSLYSRSVDVNLSELDEWALYHRGLSRRIHKIKSWKTLFRQRRLEVESYDRLVLAIRFTPGFIASSEERRNALDSDHIYIKYFRNVPLNDLEMVFPNTSYHMSIWDKIKVAVPTLGAAVLAAGRVLPVILAVAGGVAGASMGGLEMAAVGGALGALIGIAFRAYINYKNARITYMQALTEGLYFKILDSNAGVFHRLLDAAEEEEVKEALLAQHFLRAAPLSESELDGAVEGWFKKKKIPFDFEVDDGLAKLYRLGLAREDKGKWSVIDLKDAIIHLDEKWDALFNPTTDLK
ncbi:MAG: DUF3754 domain-containing protein [Thermoplasmata archaeon]|nr:MAG: DUF3754 domain-containing protein [Thermoplasmata archaeon]